MTKEERLKIYKSLAAPFPPDAVERSRGEQTGRGYNTTGIKAQFVVDRLNEVLGIGGYRVQRTANAREITRSSGRSAYEAACDLILQLGEWRDDRFVLFAEAVAFGGHTANTEGDALKGAATNALKRAAALLGCGGEAYRGALDDDHLAEAASSRRPPVRSPTTAERGSGQVPAKDPSARHQSQEASSARITNAQLGKLRSLVAELGQDWLSFRATTQKHHGVTIEYATRALASKLIDELVASTQARRTNESVNGHGAHP